MGPFITLSEACLHSGGCSCWLLACKEKSWDGFVCLSSFCCNHCAILSAVNSKLYIRMHPWPAMFLFLSHLLVCHSKKTLKVVFVGKLCYVWEAKSVMYLSLLAVGTFVTKLSLLLVKREVGEICVHIWLAESLWGLTFFYLCPHWCFCFRDEVISVVLNHCHCSLCAPAQEGERLSLDLSEGSVTLPWAVSPVQPGKPRW